MQRSLIPLFLLLVLEAQSQIGAKIYVDGDLKGDRMFADSIQMVSYSRNWVRRSIGDGYYFAGLDSVREKSEVTCLYFHRGAKLRTELDGKKFKDLSNYLSAEVKDYANSGYPFASIQVDSSRVLDGRLVAASAIKKGPFITNDSAFFYNGIKTNHSYLYQLIDHVPGRAFSQRNYRAISRKIDRVSFLSLKRPVDISFQDEQAKLYLDLEENRSSSFKGVLGLQQQRSNASLVGSIDLDVRNLFRSGKTLTLNWERFAENSQELLLRYKHPFFLGSKLTPSFQFEILRQDSIFLTRSTLIGVSTFLSPKTEIEFQFNPRRGTLLSTDEVLISNANLADFSSDNYRIRLSNGDFQSFNAINDDLAWAVSVGMGRKEIERNLNLADSFYDTLNLSTDLFDFGVVIGKQFALAKRLTFYQSIEGGLIDNDELLNNERFRLGGLNSLRGFNEKFFFADRYVLSRSELRSFFEKGSFLYLFYDQLFQENRGDDDTPFGTGLGFSLETLSGQFSFALAIGQSRDQPFDLINLKIHFGYLTRF